MESTISNISNLLLFIKDKLYSKYFDYMYLTPNNIEQMNNKIKNRIQNLEKEIDKIIQNKKSLKIITLMKNVMLNEIITKINIPLKNNLLQFVLKIYEIKKCRKKLHKNILLIGNAGVGKSTLINSFLKINKAKTGMGKPITKSFTPYLAEPDNYFRLYDSKGFNLDDDYTESVKEIEDFIENKLLSDNPDEFIHCIWYCFTGSRYNEKEKEAIKKLLGKYEDDCLPIIITYLKFINKDEADEYLKLIKDYLKNDKINYTPVRALSNKFSDGNQIIDMKSFGLDKLEEITNEKMINATNCSYYQSIRNKIIEEYKKAMNIKIETIANKLKLITKIIQYNSIDFLNLENIFLEILELFYFNQSKNHDFKNLNSVYKNYLDDLELSYREEFYINVNLLFDEIVRECFPQLIEYELTKQNFFENFHKELREYFFTEKENNILEENEYINKEILLNLYDDNKKDIQKLNKNNINEVNINSNFLSQEQKDLDEYCDLIDEEISINPQHINRNIISDYKSQKYKIDNKDVIKLKTLERKVIEEIINNLFIEISNSIKDYLILQIKELRQIIETEIIDKLKKDNK